MTINEKIELKKELEISLRNNSFFEAVAEIKLLETERSKVDFQIQNIKNTKYFQLLKSKNITVVSFSGSSIGFVDYSKEKVNDSYYSARYDIEKGLKNSELTPLSDEQILVIEEILEGANK